jgi:hypothetical protein
MKRLPTLVLTTLLALSGLAVAQSPTPLPVEEGKPVELYRLAYNEEKAAFVDPANQEPFTGPIIVTYPVGQPETIGRLEAGKEDGYWREFYENGTKSAEGRYDAGTETGQWYYYWENGRIESEGVYEDGAMEGVWKDYFASGKLTTAGTYLAGKADGAWQIADEDTGELVTVHYKDGEEIPPPADQSAPTPEPSPTPEPTATP